VIAKAKISTGEWVDEDAEQSKESTDTKPKKASKKAATKKTAKKG
jgi:hypothetical protein